MAQEQEQEPFLLHEKDNGTEPTPKSSIVDDLPSPSPSTWQNWKPHLLAHAVLITIYTLLSITFILAHTTNSSSAAPRRKNLHPRTTNPSIIYPPYPNKVD